ncbi:receptor activity-modifying protein 1-like [Plectropomus leopardus]|uniref:receptor activity-modifying protein 1-like n=1 Tax=Plectropomus leopardus TaxID=160734 RepID=UPI001C4AE1AC|nr:receptor activity-modifying protein 1-like [Plectropomus leopardus]
MVFTAYLLALVFIWTGMEAKFVVPPCDRHMFDSGVSYCLSDFNRSMETSGYQDSCPWPTVKRIYNQLKVCMDKWANVSWCRGHGFLVDQVFLEVHQIYFRLCGQVQDPPLITLIMLIAPVIIATFLMPVLCVNLTTWNTEMPSSLGL